MLRGREGRRGGREGGREGVGMDGKTKKESTSATKENSKKEGERKEEIEFHAHIASTPFLFSIMD